MGQRKVLLFAVLLAGCGSCAGSSTETEPRGPTSEPDPGVQQPSHPPAQGEPAGGPEAADPSSATGAAVEAAEPPESGAGEQAESSAGTGETDEAPSPSRRGPACDRLAARFAERLEAASGACRSDRQCDTYPSGIDRCGGITDGATARALRQIANRYHNQGCPTTVRCARRILDPVCVDGACRNRADLPAAETATP